MPLLHVGGPTELTHRVCPDVGKGRTLFDVREGGEKDRGIGVPAAPAAAVAERRPKAVAGAPAAILALQRSAGNRAATLAVQRAGTPRQMDAPAGLTQINRRPPMRVSILGPAGRTLALDDFEPPRLEIDVTAADSGRRGAFVARAQPTSSRDAVHESFYPGPGRHHFGQIVRDGRRYESFFEIPRAQSDLIRRGEQEHLNDHERAYRLSYGRLTTVINELSRRQFPGATEEEARAAVMAELRRRLTRLRMQAFHDPATWHRHLVALLRLSSRRDSNGWHTLQPGRPRLDGDEDVTPLVRGPRFSVGTRPSSSVVSLAGMRRP